jgi:hypothetical protein
MRGSRIPDWSSTMTDTSRDNQLKVYDQLCESYRAIDDFRAKLLGFVPLVTGAGISVLLDKVQTAGQLDSAAKAVLAAVGVFGALVTLGLFSYELYAIKKCGALIKTGARIEDLLGIDGQFTRRPHNVASVINEPFAAGIIYPTVLAAWTFFALAFTWPNANPWVPLSVLVTGLVGTVMFDLLLRRESRQSVRRSSRLERGVTGILS